MCWRLDNGRTGGGSAGGSFYRFPTTAQASDAADRLIENLESCTATEWQTQPIAQTGTVLATSADGVARIQQNGDHVDVFQLATADGAPPLHVQVDVAEWVAAASPEQKAPSNKTVSRRSSQPRSQTDVAPALQARMTQ